MESILTCICGHSEWTIAATEVRCSNCHTHLIGMSESTFKNLESRNEILNDEKQKELDAKHEEDYQC